MDDTVMSALASDIRNLNSTEQPLPERAAQPGRARIGDVLVAAGFFLAAEMDRHAEEAKRHSQRLGDYLVAKRLISRADLYEKLAAQHKRVQIDSVRELPEWDALLSAEGGPLGGKLAPSDPIAIGFGADIESGRKRCFIVGTRAGLDSRNFTALAAKAMHDGFKIRGQIEVKDPDILAVVVSEWTKRRGGAEIASSPVSKAELHQEWDKIIYDAYRAGASDIHLTSNMGRGEIKFRIHGELEPYPLSLTDEHALELAASMFNTLVEADSTREGFNARVPQDAAVTRAFNDVTLRLRYSGLPIAPSGLDVTLRLIPIGVAVEPKTPLELGYSKDQSETLERVFARSSGLILFLGTTGSGKSTSMANLLMKVVKDRPGKKLRTVEDPVEIIIPGASQTAVVRDSRKGEGATHQSPYVDVMRALMRSDPDYLMVGEIRDSDTAELALHAVRSGHLCVSTLHADGAPIAYDRLAGMGVSRQDLASVGLVAALVYQRLVPVLCPHCRITAKEIARSGSKEHAGVMRRLVTYLNGRPMDGIFFRNPAGCSECKRRGVIGRTVCAEILQPTPTMLRAIVQADSTALWKAWRATIDEDRDDVMRGRTAFEHALLKMRQGLVSPVSVEGEFKYLDEPAFEGTA